MSQHHDPVVGDALRHLDVPEHGPDFWDRLDARLAGGDAGTDEPPAPHEDKETAVVDLRDRAERRVADRRRAPLPTLAAAVAIVVALVVGAAVLSGGGDDESTVDVADVAETSVPQTPDTAVGPPPEDDAPDTAVPPETTTTIVSGDQLPADVEETASEWIQALFAGDVEAAYALLDDATQARLSEERFAEYAPGLFEGAAAFAGDGIERDVTDLDGFSVATFTGDVEREGMVETASYPVVVTPSGVHFTIDGPEVSLDPQYAGSAGTTLTSPLELVVQEETDAWIWFDGGDPQPLAGRGQVRVDVQDAVGAGTHTVTVVAAQGDAITARSYTVVVP